MTCARPGCPGAPVAWLAYDYEARCAWLDDQPSGNGRAHEWPLCKHHADTLKVPRGWFCIDRRAARRWDGWAGWDGPATADGADSGALTGSNGSGTSSGSKHLARSAKRAGGAGRPGSSGAPLVANRGAEAGRARSPMQDGAAQGQASPRFTEVL
ncbi:MAG: DUF3499 family protein [Acidimicrobiales bacterium]